MAASKRKTRRSARKSARLDRLHDAQLLDLKFSQLPISVDAAPVRAMVERLYDEMAQAGLRFRPHVWLGDEWFVPKNVPGIAIPFYLAHPRLRRLEKKMMLQVEGGTAVECMRILRHEAGHAVQMAYRLHRRREWQQHFGRSSSKYPESYIPKPYSRRFVLHLDRHYAQAHPDEDFAETFAVWLSPNSRWRSRYQGWPALRKIEYVDALMREIADQSPAVRTRRQVDAIASLHTTLREHYDQRQAFYGLSEPDLYTRDLRVLFSPIEDRKASRDAARFLRAHRKEVLSTVARWTGHYQYTLNDIYQEMIDRCEEHAFRYPATNDPVNMRTNACVLLAVLAMNTVAQGGHSIKL